MKALYHVFKVMQIGQYMTMTMIYGIYLGWPMTIIMGSLLLLTTLVIYIMSFALLRQTGLRLKVGHAIVVSIMLLVCMVTYGVDARWQLLAAPSVAVIIEGIVSYVCLKSISSDEPLVPTPVS